MLRPLKQGTLWGAVVTFIMMMTGPLLGAQEENVVLPQIIVHAETLQEHLTSKEVQNIFLGRKTTWHDQSPIVFVVLKNGPVHEQFLRTYVKKTPSQFSTYWKKQVFTGKGKMPKAFVSEEKLMAYVAKTPGAVGYVEGTLLLEGVKKMMIQTPEVGGED